MFTGGEAWRRVRDPAGNVGWVLGSLLAPQSPSPTASVTRVSTSLSTPTATRIATPTTVVPTPTVRGAGYGLNLLSADGYRQGGLIVVEGRVSNVGDADLRSLWAAVDLYDANEALVKSQAAPLSRETLSPGQVSAFKVAAVDDPAVVFYTVGFRDLRGTAVPSGDQR